MTKKGQVTVALAAIAALGTGTTLIYTNGDQPKTKPDLCGQGWPPESYCFPAGWKIIAPDGTVYRGGGELAQ